MRVDPVNARSREAARQAPPPAALLRVLEGAGLGPVRAGAFAPTTGGNTNLVWRWQARGGALGVKLVQPGADTPLFPNDPAAEFAALRALEGTGLAPRPVALCPVGAGRAVIYRWVEGRTWDGAPEPLARLLRRLHALPPPGGLRAMPADPLAHGAAMLAGLGSDSRRAALEARRPEHPPGPAGPAVFLHADPVPANVVLTPEPLLIDWQCPARGEAAEDIAVALSPGMRRVYGGPPVSAAGVQRFLEAYADPAATRRYTALAPALHWRLAAYCLWRAMQGGPLAEAYAAGFEAELAARFV
ncbi:phosphotransferase family protein [Oceanicella sp. SM1341]|uniref:phosphotransferase family protein n=1 Tax=Oceanicella sp. SM1341 TaxID=1548889 RepID=UPI000E46BBAB|nr:phosphotransferase [Oceanicella sp. SM1341]